jgi:8-oxo-dGTP diphosphatase
VPGARYQPRPSAYAVIRDGSGAVAVVFTPEGVFLPGGGIDPGETPAQAVAREGQEECGFALRVLEELGRAVQLVEKEGRFLEKESVFFRAEVVGSAQQTELDHRTEWLQPEEAAAVLTYESHRRAVR